MDKLTTVVKIGLSAGRIHFSKSVGTGSALQHLLGDLSTNIHFVPHLRDQIHLVLAVLMPAWLILQ